MRLSNKSTFSFVFLILIGVLCAYVAMPVMAHNTPGAQHPVTILIPADNEAGTPEIPPHTAHPTTSITLKDIADVAKNGEALVTTTAATVTVVVDFSGSELAADNALNESDFNIAITNANGDILISSYTPVAGSGPTSNQVRFNSATPDSTDPTKFDVEFALGTNFIPPADAAADAANREFTFILEVVESAVTAPVDLVGANQIPGGGSLPVVGNDALTFKLVSALTPEGIIEEEDTTPPTLEISHDLADGTALTAGDTVIFTFTFNEELGSNTDAFTSGDIVVEGGTPSGAGFGGSGLVYTLEVLPDGLEMPVKVTVAANAVQNLADLTLAADVSETFYPADNTHPTVKITAIENKELVDGVMEIVITFTFDFSEEISSTYKDGFTRSDLDNTHSNFGRVLGNGEPVQDAIDPTKYTFKVVAASIGPTRIRLQAGSVADTSNNVLLSDQDGQYTPETVKPGITITGPTLLAQRKFVGNNIRIELDDRLGIRDGLAANEITITNGVMNNDFVYSSTSVPKHATFTIRPNIGAVQVKVTVKANSVFDYIGNGNAETSKWFQVGPVLRVPANGHLVVVKDFNRQATFTFLSDDTRPTEGEINPVRPAILSARQINISNWLEMPDLERMFDFATGEGGGALVLKKATSQAALGKGAVGITEIMWASDLNRIGLPQDAEARYQWIELENLTNAAVNVHLFNKVGRETYTIETDEIDRAGNFYDGSIGENRWAVNTRGQNGNSYTGVDFISMHRNLPNLGKGHNYANINGMDDGGWVKSNFIFLTKVARNGSGKEYWHRGTPGRRHVNSTDATTVRAGATSVPSSPVIFNEVANRSDERYEWIELRNVSGGEVNLKNYAITFVTAVNQEHLFYAFPNNNNAKIPAGGVLLLVDTDPRDNFDHPLAAGYDVDRNPQDQIDGIAGPNDDFKDAPRYKVTDFRSGGLPNDGKFVLILRRPEKADGGGASGASKRNTSAQIVDIAGYDDDGLRKTNYPASDPLNLNNTDLWPLVNFKAPSFSNNQFVVDTVHVRRHVGTKDGRSGAGAVDNNNGKSAFNDVGFSGIGYKRHVSRYNGPHGGDPGYHAITKGKVTELADNASVTISEIMLYQGDRGYPQWIELYNNSATQAVQLDADDGWRLVIENPDDPLGTINFKTKGAVKRILPNQTVLVVSGSARSAGSDFLAASTVFPATRTFNVYREVSGEFDMRNRSDSFVNPKAFHIKLIDGKGNLSDEIGNLDGRARTSDQSKWDFPDGVTADGERTSLIRIYDDGIAREGVSIDTSNVTPLGEKGNGSNQTPVDKTYSWIHAVDTDASISRFVRHTWYGHELDHGTPGTRRGQILPVSLSFFRPTLEDGKVVIRWTTESELDNAGFNIYRSESRNGEFKQVNDKLITGKGTTAERSNYKWVDTSAKPGVVYYYQIEDVSFAGERTPLTITKLKGLISAKDKLTTRWGELKEVQ